MIQNHAKYRQINFLFVCCYLLRICRVNLYLVILLKQKKIQIIVKDCLKKKPAIDVFNADLMMLQKLY